MGGGDWLSGNMIKFRFDLAQETLQDAVRMLDVSWMMARNEIRYKYKRSTLGPFWITFSQAIYIGSLGFIFGRIFGLRDIEFIPFLTAGMLLWSFATLCFTEGAPAIIQQHMELLEGAGNPLSIVLRIIFRNGIVFLHHIVVYIGVAVVFGIAPSFEGIVFLPFTLLLFLVNVTWITGVLSLLIPRYRDLEPLVASAVQVLFFLTPIMWKPELLGPQARFVNWNPFYHFIEVIRAPLLGDPFPIASLTVAIAAAIVGVGLYYLLLGRVVARLNYWL